MHRDEDKQLYNQILKKTTVESFELSAGKDLDYKGVVVGETGVGEDDDKRPQGFKVNLPDDRRTLQLLHFPNVLTCSIFGLHCSQIQWHLAIQI